VTDFEVDLGCSFLFQVLEINDLEK